MKKGEIEKTSEWRRHEKLPKTGLPGAKNQRKAKRTTNGKGGRRGQREKGVTKMPIGKLKKWFHVIQVKDHRCKKKGNKGATQRGGI